MLAEKGKDKRGYGSLTATIKVLISPRASDYEGKLGILLVCACLPKLGISEHGHNLCIIESVAFTTLVLPIDTSA